MQLEHDCSLLSSNSKKLTQVSNSNVFVYVTDASNLLSNYFLREITSQFLLNYSFDSFFFCSGIDLWSHIHLKVILWTGDALSLCTSVLPPDQTFDVIDTSNVGDHIGLLNVLVCCVPRLKKYVYISSIIFLSSFTIITIFILPRHLRDKLPLFVGW